MADANAYNALLGDYGDPSYWRTPMRQPNALYDGGPVWENNHAAPVTPKQRPADWSVTSGIAEAISPTMGAYGMGAGVGQTYNALNRGDYAGAAEAGLPLMAMAMVPGPKGMGKLPAAAEQPKGIRAYHGSPHDFEKFDTSKIGTGEGAQAYGHGLYFAESEGVAKYYRETLGKKTAPLNGVYDGASPQNVAQDMWRTYSPHMDEAASKRAAINELDRRINDNMQYGVLDRITRPEYYKMSQQLIPSLKEAKRLIETGEVKYEPPGRMYEVNIKADPEHFLDWDKPLSQQHQTVQNALAQHGINAPEKNASRAFDDALLAALEGDGSTTLPKQPHDPIGEQIIRQLYSKRGSSWLNPNKGAEQVASQSLREAGIPGIRYLDQGSRSAGEGSRNYVVFDPATIEILRKYGLLGPMAGGVGVNALYGSENQ